MPEVLVVMLMIGILAAAAGPGFSCQKTRADDATSKAQARNAASAMESYAHDNLGAYDGATVTILRSISKQIPSNLTVTAYANCSGDGGTTCFWVQSPPNSATNNTFRLTKKTDGRLLSSCSSGGYGGCPSGGKWSAE